MKFIQTDNDTFETIGGLHSVIKVKPRGQFLVIRNGKFYNASSMASAEQMCRNFDKDAQRTP